MEEQRPAAPAGRHQLTPEGRRRAVRREPAGQAAAQAAERSRPRRALQVARRVWIGAYDDGFIHAGNLAYMAILALFPFFIVVAAVFAALGEGRHSDDSISVFLAAVPAQVRDVLAPVARDTIAARSGWLLWAGGLVALWTVSSLIETIRDILHRAYGTPATRAFWRYRLRSTGIVVVAVVLLLVALFAQVAITGVEEVLTAWFPHLADDWLVTLATSRLIPGGVLFGAIFALFLALTPGTYRGPLYPKWPGALLTTTWWVVVSAALPWALRLFFTYNLTYGSLAGVMIALFFFWLVGLGMVAGAELNAALAVTPEEREALGQAPARGLPHKVMREEVVR